MKTLKVADLFCGAGGTTSGAMRAINELGYDVEFVAVNHWPVAIATHERNHPNVRHYCIDLDSAKPNDLVPEGELDLLLASPECRFHSPAQGGRPLDEQNRASAWHVVRWAERLYVRRIVVENVPRFVKWGPLDRRGRPIKAREGELFQAWVNALRALGYKVEWRVLNAADYGTPQARRRLFIQARRDGRRIAWPEPTHARRGTEATLAGELKTWEPARNIIDFSKRGKSIFEKKLSPNTLARIEEGVKRYCKGPIVEAFLLVLRRYADARSLDDPLPTIVASGQHLGLVEPVLRPFVLGQGGGAVARDTEEPLPTVATDGAISLVEPFIVPQDAGARPRSVDQPLPTVRTTSRGVAVVEPFLVAHFGEAPGQRPRTHDVDEPLPTVTHRGAGDLIQPEAFLVESNHGKSRPPKSLDEPLPAITQKNGVGIVEPFIVKKRQHSDVQSLDEPLSAVTQSGRNHFLVEPFVCANRTHNAPKSVDEPLPTETTSPGGGIMLLEPRIVEIDGQTYVLDLLHRMLDVDELARGQDFDGYEFAGTREQQTAQIGNAVPILLAEALTSAALHDLPRRSIEAA